MKKINNLKLRMELWETLTSHLEGECSNEKINEMALDIESKVLIWVADEGLKPSDDRVRNNPTEKKWFDIEGSIEAGVDEETFNKELLEWFESKGWTFAGVTKPTE